MRKKGIRSASQREVLKLRVSAKKKEATRGKLAVTAETLRLRAKQSVVIAKERESIKNRLEETAKQLAVTAKEAESVRRKLALTAKEKESVRGKLAVTAETLRLRAKQLAKTASEKESIRNKLEIIAKRLATTAKEKEDVRRKLVVTAKNLNIKAKQLAKTAKEKEDVRSRLVVTAEALRFKAKQLATIAKEKESVRSKLVITAETLRLKAKQLALTAKEKESVRGKLAITAKTLRLKAKQLEKTAKEKEGARHKLEIVAKELAAVAKEKESIKRRLEVTAKELAVTAKRIELANKYTRSLIEASLDPLVIINPKGKISDLNASTGQVTGFAREDLIGTDFSVYFTEPEKARKGLKRVFKEGSVIDYPLTIRNKAGKLIDVLYNASVYKDDNGRVLGVFAAARDVTATKKATAIIESANKELKKLDLAKDEFVSIASHQLRTPLTALKGYTGMLLDGDPGPINDKQREYLREIKNANDRMITLITALLNVSRVDLGVFVVEPEPVDFVKVARSVLSETEEVIKSKKLRVETSFEELPLISADLRITRMILQNLLSNAVKYTSLEGSISFKMKRDGSNLLISVADTGCGIPEDVQSKIFTKMFRADNARQKDPTGTGLGLYIIKSTIEQTGGKIWFESKENKGSTFYVSLPMSGMKKKEGSKRLE